MAVTQNTYTGNGSTTNYSFTFPYLEETDIKVTLNGTTTTAYTLANATQISFNTAPGTGVAIRIYRETALDSAQATFFAGSAIRAQDLNDNNNQLLYSTQETVNRRLDRTGGTLTGDLVMDDSDIVFEGATDDAFETTLTVVDPTADRTITLPDVTGTVVTTGDTGTVATAMIAADAVNGTKIADDSINSEHYVDGSIDTQHIADAQITTAKIAADAVTNAKIADDSIDSEHYVDGSIDTAHIADLQVTTAKIAADAITNAKIADDSIDSEHYVDGSIDTAHIGDLQVSRAKIAADAIDGTKLADDAVDSEHYTDGSIDTAHIGDSQVTTAKIADGAVTNAKLADAELQELATMGGLTAAALADLTQAEVQILDGATVTTAELNLINGLTADATDLNQLDTNTLTNSPTWNSTSQYPSAASIDSRITARIDPLGGFEAIADEDSFPATAPPEGTVVSIANANGLVVNAGGVGAGTRAGGSDAVVINGFPSGFNSTSLDDGIGLLVVATSTAHTYDFHRVVAKNEDVRQLSSDINDFKARYRVGSTNPTTDLDAGDLFFNTGTSKMLVWDAGDAAWEEVQSIGEFFINTLSSSGGTGGGSATFNGTAFRFTLSNPPNVAEQLIVSINGVVQKPNSGTSQPSEGFALDGADIIFSDAPAASSPFFIITIGSTVNIGTPSANTVANVHVSASAAIAGTKIDPDFGSQTVETTGVFSAAGGAQATPSITFTGDLNTGIYSPGADQVAVATNGTGRLFVASDGKVGIGTSSPISKVHIQRSAVANAPSRDNALYLENNANCEITMVGNPANDCQIRFGTSSNSFKGALEYQLDVDALLAYTNGSEKLRITNAGLVGIGTSSPADRLSVNAGAANTFAANFFGPLANLNHVLVSLSDDPTTKKAGIGFQKLDGFRRGSFFIFNNNDANASTSGGINDARLTVTSAGNVGIGVTSPANPLHVRSGGSGTVALFGDSAANNTLAVTRTTANPSYVALSALTNVGAILAGPALKFETTAADGTSAVERLRIDSSGRLLIGTSSDRSNVPGVSVGVLIEGASGANTNKRFVQHIFGSGDGSGPYLGLGKHRGTSIGGNTLVVNGDELGGIYFQGADGSNFIQGASIMSFVDGTPGANDMPCRLVFSTTSDGASSPTERMRIGSNGQTYWGSSAPGAASFGTSIGRSGLAGFVESYRNVNGTFAAVQFGGTAGYAQVMGDGDLENTNNRYTGLSDNYGTNTSKI
jgi:hypothetical protein